MVSVVGNRKHDPALADPETVSVPDPEKVVVLTRTTLSVDDVRKTIEILKARFPKLVVPPSDDLCYATKNRQDAVRGIAPHVDLFLVVMSDYSSNEMRLLELADDLCGNAKRVESAADIEEAWLENVRALGITSAASTPDDLVQEMVAFFRARNADLELSLSIVIAVPRFAAPGEGVASSQAGRTVAVLRALFLLAEKPLARGTIYQSTRVDNGSLCPAKGSFPLARFIAVAMKRGNAISLQNRTTNESWDALLGTSLNLNRSTPPKSCRI